MSETLYMIIPCYNEEEVLPDSAAKLGAKIKDLINRDIISDKSKIIFVNDGSMDLTWKLVKDLHEEDSVFGGINLSRNRGHQNAILAGMLTVKEDSDMIITMDADLQDDIEVIETMVEEYYKGYDIVYGVRNDRSSDSFFKRNTAQLFYKFTNKLGGNLVYNHADFRLMSKRALDGLEEFSEVNLFLRGIVPLIGFPSTKVEYERKERLAGESKYPFGKMLALAFEGITSLSVRPMRIVTMLGLLVFLGSLVMLVYILVSFFSGHVVPGWSSVAVSVWVIGGIQLLAIGIIGEYIGKIYLEAKKRPRYIVEEYLRDTNENRNM